MLSIRSFIFEGRGLVLIAKNQQFHIKSLGVSVFLDGGLQMLQNIIWKSAKHSKTMQLSATDMFCSVFHACECEQLCLFVLFAEVCAAPIYHETARLKTNVVFGLRTPFRTHQNVPITDSPPLRSAYEPLSRLIVSPLITPIIPPLYNLLYNPLQGS